jgi:serine/threonine protein kinase
LIDLLQKNRTRNKTEIKIALLQKNRTRNKTEIKICDFGTAISKKEKKHRTDEIVPRFYRAPEIILGHPYDHKIDIWSAGCTLLEIATGEFLSKIFHIP